jgi:hypothetical protein
MTDAVPAAVTYVGLPISSGGAHSLGRMSRRVAYARTQTFIQECTDPVGPVEFSLVVNDVPELDPVPELTRAVKRRFGALERRGSSRHVVIREERVGEVLDFVDDIDPQPTNQWGMAPVWFWLTCKFQILDPATQRPLPGQSPQRYRGVEYEWGVPLGTSGLRLILHNHAQLGIELCIPDALDDVLARLVPWLQDHLPCKLSPKQWRAWTPTRSGSFKARKLSAPGS